MAIEDDDKPRKKITHEIGQDLSLLSVEELTERIALMNSEIERLQQAAPKSARRRMRRTVFSRRELLEPDLSPRRPGLNAGTHTPRLRRLLHTKRDARARSPGRHVGVNSENSATGRHGK